MFVELDGFVLRVASIVSIFCLYLSLMSNSTSGLTFSVFDFNVATFKFSYDLLVFVVKGFYIPAIHSSLFFNFEFFAFAALAVSVVAGFRSMSLCSRSLLVCPPLEPVAAQSTHQLFQTQFKKHQFAKNQIYSKFHSSQYL